MNFSVFSVVNRLTGFSTVEQSKIHSPQRTRRLNHIHLNKSVTPTNESEFLSSIKLSQCTPCLSGENLTGFTTEYTERICQPIFFQQALCHRTEAPNTPCEGLRGNHHEFLCVLRGKQTYWTQHPLNRSLEVSQKSLSMSK